MECVTKRPLFWLLSSSLWICSRLVLRWFTEGSEMVPGSGRTRGPRDSWMPSPVLSGSRRRDPSSESLPEVDTTEKKCWAHSGFGRKLKSLSFIDPHLNKSLFRPCISLVFVIYTLLSKEGPSNQIIPGPVKPRWTLSTLLGKRKKIQYHFKRMGWPIA